MPLMLAGVTVAVTRGGGGAGVALSAGAAVGRIGLAVAVGVGAAGAGVVVIVGVGVGGAGGGVRLTVGVCPGGTSGVGVTVAPAPVTCRVMLRVKLPASVSTRRVNVCVCAGHTWRCSSGVTIALL